MDLKDIEMVLVLYSEKSITKAAEKLFVSQPALTKRIKKLEDFFRTNLIVRNYNGIAFTYEGEKLVSYCKEISTTYQNLLEEMKVSKEEISGSLAIGAAAIYAHYKLPKLVHSYLDQFPKVSLDIKTDLTARIFRMLENNEIAIGILREGYAWEDEKILLSNEPLCIAYHEKIELPELLTKKYIQYKTDPHLQYQIDHWWNERFSDRPKIGISTSSVDTSIELVRAGLGWSILPSIALDNFDGYIQELKWLNGLPFTRATWLCYKKNSLNSRAVASFVQYVEETLGTTR